VKVGNCSILEGWGREPQIKIQATCDFRVTGKNLRKLRRARDSRQFGNEVGYCALRIKNVLNYKHWDGCRRKPKR
jgi:hypothetical protein